MNTVGKPTVFLHSKMRRNAFTLVELLVVVAIIGLLSTVAVVSLTSTQTNARNQKRKADLLQISKALELYFADNGAYPSTGTAWHGHCSLYGGYPDTGATAWIPDISPTYMASLPRDPRDSQPNPSSAQGACLSPSQNCYLYRSDGNNYKLLAHCTPEGTMLSTDTFYDSSRPTWAWTIYSQEAAAW
jgi:type II secretion system protein G